MFRPGFIQPLHGIVSKTKLYRVLYAVVGPLYPLWKALLPELRDDDRAGRAGDDRSREGRRAEAGPRESRHQRPREPRCRLRRRAPDDHGASRRPRASARSTSSPRIARSSKRSAYSR